MNLYLFRKYWSKHKGRLFSLILSIMLLSLTFVFSVLNERTELRRRLHELYNVNGFYNLSVMNVTDDQEQQICDLPMISAIGKVVSVGKINIAETEYTLGYFENKEAEELSHIPLIEGELPTHSGQIAMPKFILEQLQPDAKIGQNITIKYFSDSVEISSEYELSGIISNNTNRSAMEYTAKNNGQTIEQNEIDFPLPTIYLFKNDVSDYGLYSDLLISIPDETSFSDMVKQWGEVQDKLWEISDNIVVGGKDFVLTAMSDMEYSEQGHLQTKETSDILIIRIISVMMMIVAAISMFSGIVSVMPQRIESFRLLKSIGMSRKKLLSVFITEFSLFWIIGTFVGVLLACTLHEILIRFQSLIGLAAYRGYAVEYVINEKTISPFIIPVVMSFIITLLCLIIPIRNIVTITFYRKPHKIKFHRNVSSFNAAYSKMTGRRFLALVSCISITVVMCTAIFGYCYYTQSGKGVSYLSIGKTDTEASYYTVNGVDLKKNNLDCAVTAYIPTANDIAVYDKEYGINSTAINDMSKSANIYSWAAYPAFSVIYKENEKVPEQLESCIVPFNEKWEYYNDFKTNKIYDVGLILINDNMLRMLDNANSDDIVLISKNEIFPYKIGDNIPMFSCICNDTKHIQLDKMKQFNVEVTKQIDLNNINYEKNDILYNSGILNFSSLFAIAMTAEKAEELGFYHPEYSSALLKFTEIKKNEEMKEYVSSVVKVPSKTVTLNDLEKAAKINKLSANANPVILFIMLFALCFISIWNLSQMNVQNNIEKFLIIHSIGVPMKKIKKMFIISIIRFSSFAVICGVLISLAGKGFMTLQYNKYSGLLEQQQELAVNDSFPETIIEFSSLEFDKTDKMYVITEQMEKIKSNFMLDKEMWLPDLIAPLCIISCIFIMTAFVISLLTAKKINDKEGLNNDKS